MLKMDYYRMDDCKKHKVYASTFQEILNSSKPIEQTKVRIYLGDVLFIDTGGNFGTIPFEIVHRDFDKRVIYLMAKRVFRDMPFYNTKEFLTNLLYSFPSELQFMLKPVNHMESILGDNLYVSIPTVRNLGFKTCSDNPYYLDEITFQRFARNERVSQVKRKRYDSTGICSYNQSSQYMPYMRTYWTDSIDNENEVHNYFVTKDGNASIDYRSKYHGVCPIIKFAKD